MQRFSLLLGLAAVLTLGACSASDALLAPDDQTAARPTLQDGGDTSSNNGSGGGKP